MRYKVTCAYDGSNYVGFQSQKNGLAIQDIIEKALKEVCNKEIRIVLSSRTDAGGLNAKLPKDIHIIKIQRVSDKFHARYSVKSKTYEYLINIGEYDVFLKDYAYYCPYKLDIEKMKKASSLFIGSHDFSSFNTSTYKEKPNQIRNINEFKIIKKGSLLKIRISGDGFLRNMVRIIVGSLVELGRGKKDINDIKRMLENPCKDTRRYNISPKGLYLVKIKY